MCSMSHPLNAILVAPSNYTVLTTDATTIIRLYLYLSHLHVHVSDVSAWLIGFFVDEFVGTGPTEQIININGSNLAYVTCGKSNKDNILSELL